MPLIGYRILAVLALCAALIGGYSAWHSHVKGLGYAQAKAEYALAIANIQAGASKLLASETEKAHNTEKALRAMKDKLEIKDVANQKTIAGLSSQLRTASSSGRLRDPQATSCRPSGSSAPAEDSASASIGTGDGAEADGLFSAGATELLTRLTREADEINAAYASCRAWVAGVTSP